MKARQHTSIHIQRIIDDINDSLKKAYESEKDNFKEMTLEEHINYMDETCKLALLKKHFNIAKIMLKSSINNRVKKIKRDYC